MSLIKKVKEKIAEGTNLQEIKQIIKQEKDGSAFANFIRYAEELSINKMIMDGKTDTDILAYIGDQNNHFELNWTAERLTRLKEKESKGTKPKNDIPVQVHETDDSAPEMPPEPMKKKVIKKSKPAPKKKEIKKVTSKKVTSTKKKKSGK